MKTSFTRTPIIVSDCISKIVIFIGKLSNNPDFFVSDITVVFLKIIK